PSLIGARVYVGLSELAFRRVVLALLSGSGVAMLVAAVPRLLAR
ncbi:MAG: sulfite exporter TauE/SafE family protein, partial [Rubrivivax sp.]